MRRSALLPFLLAGVLVAQGQPGTPAAQEQAPAPTQALQGNWSAASNQQNLALYNGLVQERPEDGLMRYQLFQSERQASLARNNGRLPKADAERLEEMAREIGRHDPDGFGSALATYYLRFPAPDAFQALARAEAVSPGHPELIAPRLGRAIRSGDAAALRTAALDLRQRGGVAPGLWHYAEDLLRSVEDQGVLVYGGELDGYPSVALQQGEGRRADVVVVDVRLLADAGYRGRLWKAAGGTGNAPAASEWIAALARSTKRPVHVSMAVDRAWIDPLRGQLRPAGLTFRLGASQAADMAQLTQRWEAMHRTPDAGPLSWNYLVAGSVLLRHHRSVGDEAAAARTEHALRRLADRIGATSRLYELGVLLH